MSRRQKRAEHDNHERWLISYADFITLLFAFFVVMYSISSVNEGKYKTFSDSLNTAFSKHPDSIPTSPNIVSKQQEHEQMLKLLVDKRDARLLEQQHKAEEKMVAIDENLHRVMASLVQGGQVGIYRSRRGVVVDISASTLFREGEATIQADALETLHQVALVLSSESQGIEVEGHTDDVPIRNAQFPSNWELSAGRASSVVRMLIAYGVPEQRLTAVGMAANQPVVANDTAEHRARNRRVSITILSPEFERLMKSESAVTASAPVEATVSR